MSDKSLELGKRGELIAVSFLKTKGYRIICTNYRTTVGQIDIIARDKSAICFIEVKTRRQMHFGQPDEAVEARKQRKISQSALIFLKKKKFLESSARFDVVSIYYGGDTPQIELIKDAFPLDKSYIY